MCLESFVPLKVFLLYFFPACSVKPAMPEQAGEQQKVLIAVFWKLNPKLLNINCTQFHIIAVLGGNRDWF